MTFIESLYRALAAAGSRTILYQVRRSSLEPTTGDALVELTRRARGFLSSHGIRPGDRVALCAANSPRWIALDLAILGAGAIVVPLYDKQAPKELAAVLEDSGASLALVENEGVRERLAAVWPEADKLVSFDDVFAHACGDDRLHPSAPDDCVSLIYTSGTSGDPKGVMLTTANVDFMLAQTITRMSELVLHHHGQDRMFHYLPLCFASSRITAWSALARGSAIYLSTNVADLPLELAAVRPHFFLNVPLMLERIKSGIGAKVAARGVLAHGLYRATVAAHLRLCTNAGRPGDSLLVALGKRVLFRAVKRQLGAELEFLVSGSAPLSEATQHWFNLLGIPVYQAYGLTETTAIVTMDRKGSVTPGCVGRAVEGVEVRLAPDGELLCRGANVFPGYWKRPELNAEVLRDGWFHTGDLAELGAEGDVRIIGRKKSLLVLTTGLKVAPDPIEEALAQNIGNAHVVVVGHGRPYLSALFAGDLATEEAERALEVLNGTLPDARRVRRYALVREPFTSENGLLTANLKLRRAAVETRYAREIASLYA